MGSGKPAYGVTCLPAVLSGFPGFVLQRVKGLGTPSLSPRERIERRQSDAGGKPSVFVQVSAAGGVLPGQVLEALS